MREINESCSRHVNRQCERYLVISKGKLCAVFINHTKARHKIRKDVGAETYGMVRSTLTHKIIINYISTEKSSVQTNGGPVM
jgi:hypothetical protein